MDLMPPTYRISIAARVKCLHVTARLNILRHVTLTINDNREFLTARTAVIAVAEKIFFLCFKMIPHQAIIEWE